MLIGTFEKDGDGYYGKIRTAFLDLPVSIKPSKSNGNDKAPNFQVYSKTKSGVNIGAAWNKQSAAQNDYLSLKMDCPSLPAPINANLIEKDGKYILLWDRE